MKHAYARHTDPQSSHDAARSVDTTTLEQLVMLALEELGGGTSASVSEHLDLDRVSISPRFKPLERKGLIRRTDRREDGSQIWEACAR